MITRFFQAQWRAAIAGLLLGLGALGAVAPASAQSDGAPAAQSSASAPPLAKSIVRTPMVTGWPDGHPVSERLLSPTDNALFKEAYTAATKRDWPRARAMGERVRHPVAKKFIDWTYLTHNDTEPAFEDLVRFLEDNPNWPSQDKLLRKAEKALPDLMPPQQLITWFAGQEPLTGEGKIRLGKALIATGKTEYGASWLRRAFAEDDFSGSRQREVYAEIKSYLDQETIDKRLDRLLWTTQHVQAAWLLPYASSDKRRVAEARIALMRSSSNALTLAANLSADERADPGVLFDEVRYLRRRGEDKSAQRILTQVVKDKAVPYPEKWWIERNVQVRKALKVRDYRVAYDIAKNHGMSRGGPFSEGAFLAGWLSLRYLKKPDEAYAHFAALEKGVSFPISLARARYWMGRAAEASGDTERAREAYRRATEFPYTFYGQLAAEASLMANRKLELPLGSQVLVDVNSPFFRNELVTAIRLLYEIEGERYVRTLAYHLAGQETPYNETLFLAELMRRIGHESIAVRVAKKASQRHLLLTDYLYPVLDLPKYRGRGEAPEPAMVLGLSRQESEFNPRAVSSAGARGLMQLMPSTAKITARKHGLPYSKSRLLTDPTYNMQIGMAHLGDLLERFNGSYIMVFAGYNAGPNRVSQWVTEYGDPRTGSVDPIDWIESIPFSETRNYVQRVLENVMVYRHRIVGQPVAFMVSTDLRRTSDTPPVSYATLGAKSLSAQSAPADTEPATQPPPAPRTASMGLEGTPSPPRDTPAPSAPVDAPPAPQASEPPSTESAGVQADESAALIEAQEAAGPAEAPQASAPPATSAAGAPQAGSLTMAPIPNPSEGAGAREPQRPDTLARPVSEEPDDYLPRSGRVSPDPIAPSVEQTPMDQTPQPQALAEDGSDQAAETSEPPLERPRALAPSASKLGDSTPSSPPVEPSAGWSIPLDCNRFVVQADGSGECID